MWRLPALAGGALMPASLFFHWYEVDPGIFADRGFALEGWDVFESTDAVLTLAAAATLLLVVTVPPNVGRTLMVVGAIATGVVAIALVDKPNFFGLPYVPGLSMKIGAWLALLGALLVLTAGALRSASQRGGQVSDFRQPGQESDSRRRRRRPA